MLSWAAGSVPDRRVRAAHAGAADDGESGVAGGEQDPAGPTRRTSDDVTVSRMRRFARVAAWAVAFFWLGSGLWAFLAPQSFFNQLATFPPYNEHLLHDIGAFSIGLGDRFPPAKIY